MTIYAVGDLQGCRAELEQLLDKLSFSSDDKLWLVGDLINRGPDSLGTLRFVHGLGAQAEVVLGNHDLHLLAIVLGGHKGGNKDTFDEILAAPDRDELVEWLSRQKLMHLDESLGWAMVHAGIPHIWGIKEAAERSAEVEAVIHGAHSHISRGEFFKGMYGNHPDLWSAEHVGLDRLRCITNYLTRMRLINQTGRLELSHKGVPDDAPDGWTPWYALREPGHVKIVFGHWAALDGVTGRDDIYGTDTGCVWGRKLTALNLTTNESVSVAALS